MESRSVPGRDSGASLEHDGSISLVRLWTPGPPQMLGISAFTVLSQMHSREAISMQGAVCDSRRIEYSIKRRHA